MKPNRIFIISVFLFFSFNSFSQYIGQIISPRSNMQSIYFTDIDTGYCVGNWMQAQIFKTVNSGLNWVCIHTDTTLYCQYSDVFFYSPDTGFVVGSLGVYKTVDGGVNWTNQTLGSFASISCPSRDTCYIAGGGIIKTTDGGLNWQSVYNGSSFNSIDFIDSKTGYAAGWNQTIKTTDGGNTWTTKSTLPNIDISFENKDTGYAVGGLGGLYTGQDTIRKTTDGGNNWISISTNCNDYLSAIQDLGGNIVMAACTSFVGLKVIKSIDGGLTWNLQYQPSNYLGANNLFFLDQNNGWVCGRSGNAPPGDSMSVYKTSNGGGNFVPLSASTITDNESVSIYPNPFFMQTTLQTEKFFKNASLTVYNSFGQAVKQIKNISGQTITLHRDNLPSGLYFIRLIENNKTIATDKLVITDD